MVALPVSKDIEIKSHSGQYKVFFNENAIENLNNNIPDKVHFIIDKNVANLYRYKIANILRSKSVLIIDALENNKSLDKLPEYVDHLVSMSLRRDEILIAIGGGIIQDITCFLSNTMLRGVEWYFYPTTLLSQADSCIGSKSSINSGGSKNILGTFNPPKKVFISTSFLETLEKKEILSGIGEMIKVHIINGENSFNEISKNYENILLDKKFMISFVYSSLIIKKEYIEILVIR